MIKINVHLNKKSILDVINSKQLLDIFVYFINGLNKIQKLRKKWLFFKDTGRSSKMVYFKMIRLNFVECTLKLENSMQIIIKLIL